MTESQKEERLILTTPDEWTLDHWRCFNAGRQVFIEKARAAKEYADNLTANYYGVKALIESGYVHFIGAEDAVDKAKKMLAMVSPPLSMMGFLDRKVADRIEAAFDTPPSF